MFEEWRIQELLRKQPGLSLVPANNGSVRVAGELVFSAEMRGKEKIEDSYEITMDVPRAFPRDLPAVWETGGRIPKDFHKMQDGALCLGSPTRQMLLVQTDPTLPGFVNTCLVPYLYGYSYLDRNSVLPFDELKHGALGLIEDYCSLFAVEDGRAAVQMVMLAGMRRRFANKVQCPCGSGRRLGKCHNMKVNGLRNVLGRKWFQAEHLRLTVIVRN